MPKYMLVYKMMDDETRILEWGVSFYDTFAEADSARMDYECCMGAYVEMYQRMNIGDKGMSEYRFIL